MWRYLLAALLLLPTSAAQSVAQTAAPSATEAANQLDGLNLLLNLLRERPEDVAFSIYAVTPGQSLSSPVLSHRPDQAMPLASSMKIVVLAAYARAVASGELDPEQPVTLEEWERFYVLRDGGAHAAALKELDIPADYFGRAKDTARTVTLDTLARVMIQFSDNAATDVLMTRLGRERLAESVQRLRLEGQEPLSPIAGVYTAWNSSQSETLLALTPTERADRYWDEAARVAAEPALRNPWRIMAGAKKKRDAELDRTLQNQTFPGGTAQDYAQLMSGVLGADTGQFTADELAVMRRHLGWLLEVSPKNAEIYSAAYMKGGSLEHGVLTQNYAMTPKAGPQAGQSYAVSLFFRNLTPEENEATSKQLNDLMLRLAFDSAARAALQQEIHSLDD